MFNLQFNTDQKLEFSKALFNLGNILAGTLIINQAVWGMLTLGMFIFGLLCFTGCFATAILLLTQKGVDMYVSMEVVYGSFTAVVVLLAILVKMGDRHTPPNKH